MAKSLLEYVFATELLLLDIEKYHEKKCEFKIGIPSGIITPTKQLLPKFSFVRDNTQKRNLTYYYQQLEFRSWILHRFSMYGPVKSLFVKSAILDTNAMLECMVRDYVSRHEKVDAGTRYPRMLLKFKKHSVRSDLAEKLTSHNNRRRTIHLHLSAGLENDSFGMEDWNKSVHCLKELIDFLNKN